MMSLRNYINDVTKTYTYRVKCIFELSDEHMEVIERYALPYAPVDISRPKRHMFQTNLIDFPKVVGAELHVVDLILSLPMSPMKYIKDLENYFQKGSFIVRSIDDPLELELYDIESKAEVSSKGGAHADALTSDPDYSEVTQTPGSDHYGQEYNSKLLNYLKDVQEKREKENKVDVKANPLFSFLDNIDRETYKDFNDDIDGAPHIGDSSGEKVTNDLSKSPYSGVRLPYKRKYGGKEIVSTGKNDEK